MNAPPPPPLRAAPFRPRCSKPSWKRISSAATRRAPSCKRPSPRSALSPTRPAAKPPRASSPACWRASSRCAASGACIPVKRHGNRRTSPQEQGRGRESTGPGPCIFLLIQAKYRGFTSGVHPCGETRNQGQVAWATTGCRRPAMKKPAGVRGFPPPASVARAPPPQAGEGRGGGAPDIGEDSKSHPSNAKRPLGFPAGAIPTVDFLLARLAAPVKKTGVKTLDAATTHRTADGFDLPSELHGRKGAHAGARQQDLV